MAIDNELRHLGDAASLVVERLVGPVEGMHRAISGSAFRYVGAPGRPVQAVHDSMVGGVYSAVRRSAGLLGAGAGLLLANRMTETSPISESSKGAGLQAALNGVWGDELAARGNHLAVELSIRVDGSAVAVDRASLAAAYPEASNHIVILLHGLGQTERCWEPGLPDRLVEDSLATPVLVRYNSGLSVEQTGIELAELVESLVDNWPDAQPRVSLVGYSMGGLVARSTYAAGTVSGHSWTRSARDLVTVGAPHHGSPVARGARIGSRILRITATTRPLGDFIETSSAGIKDLDDGAGVGQAWEAAGAASPEPIRQHFLAAVVTDRERHPVGVVAGDLIVRVASAAGRSLGPRNVRVVGRRRHFSLLSDPDVLDQVIDWLGEIGD
jgi:pimeloyl-ACP methyl ester carboxylesterase